VNGRGVDLARLVVKLSTGEIGRIIGNPHTFRGRFEVAISPTVRVSCSIGDVTPETLEAQYWLAGYLTGAEPSPYDVLGDDYDESLPDDSELIQRWRDTVNDFQSSGVWAPE